MASVELRLAFEWTCDTCGRDNFERGVPADDNDRQAVAEQLGEEAIVNSEWITKPDEVECEYCGDWFEVEPDEVD